jgi:light-regulated signal transduction histidine kinase (bacteriophytochrome)
MQTSLNAVKLFDVEPLSRNLSELFSSKCVAELENILSRQKEDFCVPIPCLMQTVDLSKNLQGLLHRFNGATILELEPSADAGAMLELATLRRINSVELFQLLNCNSSEKLLQLLAEKVFELSGFNRVLIYDFDAEWNGTVLAEKSRTQLQHFSKLSPAL